MDSSWVPLSSSTAPSAYNYTYSLSIERNFSWPNYYRTFHGKYWSYVFPVILAYLGIIFAGQEFLMKHRTAFGLRKSLIVWNLLLSVFSILGAIRSIPELFYTLKDFGLRHAICIQPPLNGVYGFWVVLFILSKFFELGKPGIIRSLVSSSPYLTTLNI